jgi:NAD(P)-dependent dehydrogenase (short-subunit alcohol dehydrogenase family)
MARFDGKAILITGGSSGIGAATARRFGAEGGRVMICALDEDGCRAVADEIVAGGGEAAYLHGDLAGREFCDQAIDETVARFGRLDVLVNNAGISRRGTVETMSDEDWRLTFAVNLDAMFFLSRRALPIMKRQGGGVIVNTASELAITAPRNNAAYAASKGAVLQFTRAMAIDHAREGIRVNAICPGPVDTPLLVGHRGNPEEELKAIAEATPMGRIGTPDEIAGAITFLASDDATFITGSALLADGGVTAA